MKPELEELVARVALGDGTAFAGVYVAVVSSVWGVVRAVLRDQAPSEEVAQKVLVEAWRTAPRHRPDRGTAVNRILSVGTVNTRLREGLIRLRGRFGVTA